MGDYIIREAAIESINGTCDTCGSKGIFCGENDCSTGNHQAKLRAVPAADVVAKKDFNDCRNELCLRCGSYRESHLGACDGCLWKEV